MTTLAGAVDLPTPPAVVAALVLDWNEDPRWRPTVLGFDTDPVGPAVVGQRLRERVRVAGREVVTPTTVTAVDPGRSAVYAGGSGALRVAGRREVTATPDGGSRVRVELTLTLRGPARPLSPLLGVVYRRRFAAELQQLAALRDLAPVRDARPSP